MDASTVREAVRVAEEAGAVVRTHLVVSREPGESLEIGCGPGRVTLQIDELRGDKVRVSVWAPRWLSVDRTEVRERKEADAALAAERSA